MTADSADRIDVALGRARALRGFGRSDAAAVELRAVLAEHPQSAELWEELSDVEAERFDFPAARAAIERALSIDPESFGARFSLVNRLLEGKDFAAARLQSARLVGEYPDRSDTNILRSLSLIREVGTEAEQAEARRRVDTAIELAPEDPSMYRLGALVLDSLGSLAEARAMIAKGLALAPQDPDLLLARESLRSTSVGESVDILSAVLAQSPQDRYAARRLVAVVFDRLAAFALMPVIVLLIVFVLFWTIVPSNVPNAVNTPEEFRAALGVIVLPVVVGLWAFVTVRQVKEMLDGSARRTSLPSPLARAGLAITAVAVLILLVALVDAAWVHGVWPLLSDEPYSRSGFLVLPVVSVLLMAGEVLIRCAEYREAARSGLHPATPEGIVAASDDEEQPRKSLLPRVSYPAVVLAWGWGYPALATHSGGRLALTVITVSLVVPALVRLGLARLQMRRASGRPARGGLPVARWFVGAGTLATVAVALVVVQLL